MPDPIPDRDSDMEMRAESLTCPCPCGCPARGQPDDDGPPGWCDPCRMGIHRPGDHSTPNDRAAFRRSLRETPLPSPPAAPNPHRVGACPECGSYRTDGRPPYLHETGCSRKVDPQIGRWLAEQQTGDQGGPPTSPETIGRQRAAELLASADDPDWLGF